MQRTDRQRTDRQTDRQRTEKAITEATLILWIARLSRPIYRDKIKNGGTISELKIPDAS